MSPAASSTNGTPTPLRLRVAELDGVPEGQARYALIPEAAADVATAPIYARVADPLLAQLFVACVHRTETFNRLIPSLLALDVSLTAARRDARLAYEFAPGAYTASALNAFNDAAERVQSSIHFLSRTMESA